MTQLPSAPRILVLGNLPPHVVGGAENQIARLVEAWCSAGAHVEVAGFRIPDGRETLGHVLVRTHRLRVIDFAGRIGRAISYLWSLTVFTLSKRRKFDVAYCRGLGDGALGLVLLSAAGLCHWPIVVCPINARGEGDVAFLRSIPGWRYWCRLIDRYVQNINLINDEIGNDLDAVGITRPLRTHIPNGIEVRKAIIRAHVAPVRRLVWTGRLEPQKGLDLLLPALASCRRRGADFKLVLVGGGPLRGTLASLAGKLGLADVIEFAGTIAAGDVRQALVDADVFVLPSRYEGMSNAALEAMEAGLPVICTRCGGIDRFVSEGAGWVCESGDPISLEHCVDLMFGASDDELIRRGRVGRAIVENRLRIEQVAAENLAMILDAMRRDGHH